MFYNDAAIMKYFNETLPMFIKTGTDLRNASDDQIFKLASE